MPDGEAAEQRGSQLPDKKFLRARQYYVILAGFVHVTPHISHPGGSGLIKRKFLESPSPNQQCQLGVVGGTKTDRRPTLWGFFGLSWEREYYDSN